MKESLTWRECEKSKDSTRRNLSIASNSNNKNMALLTETNSNKSKSLIDWKRLTTTATQKHILQNSATSHTKLGKAAHKQWKRVAQKLNKIARNYALAMADDFGFITFCLVLFTKRIFWKALSFAMNGIRWWKIRCSFTLQAYISIKHSMTLWWDTQKNGEHSVQHNAICCGSLSGMLMWWVKCEFHFGVLSENYSC